MDLQTAKDYIEDLMQERDKLLADLEKLRIAMQQLETERDQLARQVAAHG
jgi:hypothetical protein